VFYLYIKKSVLVWIKTEWAFQLKSIWQEKIRVFLKINVSLKNLHF